MRGFLPSVRAGAPRKSSSAKGRKSGSGTVKALPAEVKRRSIRDGQEHIKKELLKELSGITEEMIKSAKAGSTAPLKLLWDLGGLRQDPTAKRKNREPSLGKVLMQALRKQEAEKKNEPETGKKK